MNDHPQFGFVVQYVKDIEAAKRFFEDVLGLRAERVHPTYVQFEHFAIASDQPIDPGAAREIYWLVPDAQRAFAAISASAEIVLPFRQKPFGTVFGVKDPDGHPHYLLQFATDRPSRPAS
jgi:catechol 2,3-dioxygenase-like lactoylglutathione lyase family enzyme